jgi:hypothetical protein
MNATFLDTQLVAYLSLREALGFQMRAEKLLLPDFVAFVKAQGTPGPIRARLAVEWACQTSASRGPSGAGGFSFISAHLRQTPTSQSRAYCRAHGAPHPTCLHQPS